MNPAAQFLEELLRDGNVRHHDARLTPMSGGVSSDIYLLEDGPEKWVVKRALAKLKVKDDWFADVSRSAAERGYLARIGRMMPGTVPGLHFANPERGYFAMEYLGEGFTNWKTLLLAGDCRTDHAEMAGRMLGEIHRRTASDNALRVQFDTTVSFHQLRVEPYLLTCGARHPQLRDLFLAEAQRIEDVREALVHGDFSPKNILVCGDRMVLLDCEVAWYGDPVFDVAFLLNHLFLKSLFHAPVDRGVKGMILGFWQAYLAERGCEHPEQLERRLIPLLMMLLLARVDGKSPVEYVSLQKQQFIRTFVGAHLRVPPPDICSLAAEWFSEVGLDGARHSGL